MAWMVASRGDMPSSMWRCTASTTTMASSTTMPIASTRPNMLVMLIEKPSSGNSAKRPHHGHRNGEQRNQRGAPVLQEEEHHQDHQADGLQQRDHHVLDGRVHEHGGVVGNDVVHAGREAGLDLIHDIGARGPRSATAFAPGERYTIMLPEARPSTRLKPL